MKQPSLRQTLYGLFLTTAMWACGVGPGTRQERAEKLDPPDAHTMTQKRSTYVDGERVFVTEEVVIEPNDFSGQMDALEQKFPKMYAYVTRNGNMGDNGLNRYLLQTSAVNNGGVNHFTVKNVTTLTKILQGDDADAMTMGVIAHFEGTPLSAYNHGQGKLIYNGILMPVPDAHLAVRDRPVPGSVAYKKREHLMELISEAADDAPYDAVYDGAVSLNPKKAPALGVAWLNEPGHHKDAFEKCVKDAIHFLDLPKHKRPEKMDDLALENVSSAYRALMISMVWQSYTVLSRNPKLTAPFLRVLASDDSSEEEMQQAMHGINLFYMDNILKNTPSTTITPVRHSTGDRKKDWRKNLSWRPLTIAAAINALAEYPKTEEELEQVAQLPVQSFYLKSVLRAMQLNQGDDVLIVQIGYMPQPMGDFLMDPECDWHKGTRHQVVMGGPGTLYTQKKIEGDYFWERKLFRDIDEQTHEPIVVEGDSITVEFTDVVQDAARLHGRNGEDESGPAPEVEKIRQRRTPNSPN